MLVVKIFHMLFAESGGGVIVAGVASSSLVKIRGKGADTLIVGGAGGGAAAGAGAGRVSRAHCKSSGYESIGLDSESTSVDSYTGTLADTR